MKNKILFVVVCLLVSLSFSVGTGYAQQTTGASYRVQPGDTLSSIAFRFGINLNDLVAANALIDPNNLIVGEVLSLPGIDWVSGTLEYKDVNLGETFLTLQRAYRIDPRALARLAEISSPAQMFVGYPTLIPTNDISLVDSERQAVWQTSSTLEMAAAAGINPWTIASANQLGNPAMLTPGDVVLVPGTGRTGVGALPSPITSLVVKSGDFVQGKTTVFQAFSEGGQVGLAGEFMGYPINFHSVADAEQVALIGVHVMAEPGAYPITLSMAGPDGSEFSFSQLVEVREGGYGFESITVDPATLDAGVTVPEEQFIASMTSQVTPDKLWTGYFVLPSPFGDTINSYFGTRRSFNKSEFVYFHGGVDFGGGTGVEIYAAAAGKVIFSEYLEVRGNATIIDHGWGVFTGYWHQSERYVEAGHTVQPGQLIGLVGNTGRSSGAHLHWEMWVGGVQVQPLDWLFQLYP